MKTIPIIGSDLTATVDDEDFDKVSLYKWYLTTQKGKHVRYARANKSRARGAPPRTVLMHHLVAGKHVDHKDRNGLNNTKSNLRKCTPSQNSANKKKQIGCLSKYKGVSYRPNKRRWRARIMKDGRMLHIGDFVSEKQAAISYDEAAIRMFGEFARTNLSLGLLK